MALTLHITEIANAVEALTVAGVTIYDIDEIPAAGERLTPCLYPEPLNFVTNFRTERDSTGTDADALKTAYYDLNYTFLYAAIGSGRMGLESYDDMVGKVELIIEEIQENTTLTGAVDITAQGIAAFGPVPDPVGTMWLGCRIVFSVIDFMEVA